MDTQKNKETLIQIIENILDDIRNRRQPVSASEKHQYVVDMMRYFDASQEMYEIAKWIQGACLYIINKYKLYRYLDGEKLTQEEFFESQNIAPSTGRARIEMWKFYVVKHKIPLEELAQADTHKLFRAIKVLREKSRRDVLDAVQKAKRKLLKRSDYYKLLGIKPK